MDNLSDQARISTNRSGTVPLLPARILVKKLLGMLIGALAGLPVGWGLGHYGCPWAADQHMFPIAGALAGAVIGALLPGDTLGRFGWAIALSTALGSVVYPSNPKESPPFLMGAVWGFVVGVAIGLALESVGRFRTRAKESPEM